MWDAFNFFFVPTKAGWIWAHAYPHEPMTSTFIAECEERTWAALGFDNASPSRTCDMLEQHLRRPPRGQAAVDAAP